MGRKRRPRVVVDDATKFTIFVCWLHGCSLFGVAMEVARTRQIVLDTDFIWGQIRNSPYRRRASMTMEQRQDHLDLLKSARLDEYRIADKMFKARKLGVNQR